jgi:hypothetical protein
MNKRKLLHDDPKYPIISSPALSSKLRKKWRVPTEPELVSLYPANRHRNNLNSAKDMHRSFVVVGSIQTLLMVTNPTLLFNVVLMSSLNAHP